MNNLNDPLSIWMDRAFVRSDLIRRLRLDGKTGATRTDDAVLPLVYGTARVPVQLIEKFAPTLQGHPAWTADTAHNVGDYVITSDSGYWRCTHGGVCLDNEPARAQANYAAMQRETAYEVGQVVWLEVEAPLTPGTYYYVCMTAGTTGVPDPYPEVYADMSDGGVVWRCVGIGRPTGMADLVWRAYRKTLPAGMVYEAGDVVDGTCVWRYDRQYNGTGWRQTFCGAVCEHLLNTRLICIWLGTKRYLPDSRSAASSALAAPCGLAFAPRTSGSSALPALFDSSGYTGTALLYADAAQLETGTQSEMPDLAAEVYTGTNAGGSSLYAEDMQPAYVLSHNYVGIADLAGIDLEIVSWLDYPLYCSAAGLWLSLVVDQQTTALELIGKVLQATNTDAVWSGGKLKLVPLADQTIADPVYGSTPYEPDNQARYNLGPDDFLAGGDSPIEITRRAADDCYTRYTVSYIDRSQGYTEKKAYYVDAAAIESGQADREAPEVNLGVIFPDSHAPTQVAQALAQRSAYARNQYRFRLSWRYMLLEPTDIVTLTEPAIGLDLTPVRIVDVSEVDDGYEIIAEDWPNGIAVPGGYRPQIGDGLAPDEPSSLAYQVSTFDGFRFVVDHRAAPITSAALNYGSLAGELWTNNGFELWSPEDQRGACAPDGWQTISIQASPATGGLSGDPQELPYSELLVCARSGDDLAEPSEGAANTKAGQRIWGNYVSSLDDVGVLGDTAIRLAFPTQSGSEISPDYVGMWCLNWLPVRPDLEFVCKFLIRRDGGDYASDYIFAAPFFAVTDDRDRTDHMILIDARGIASVARDTLVTEARTIALPAGGVWDALGRQPVWMRAGILLYRDGPSPSTHVAHGVDICYASLVCTTPFV